MKDQDNKLKEALLELVLSDKVQWARWDYPAHNSYSGMYNGKYVTVHLGMISGCRILVETGQPRVIVETKVSGIKVRRQVKEALSESLRKKKMKRQDATKIAEQDLREELIKDGLSFE